MATNLRSSALAATAVIVLGLAGNASAATWTFSGSNGGDTLDGSATLTWDATTSVLGVTLTNLLDGAVTAGAGELLSGIEINFSTTPTTTLLSPATGNVVDLTNPLVPVITAGGSVGHWGTGLSGGNLFLETAGNFAESATPQFMIIGSSSTGTYPDVNPSITGVHNPSVIGPTTFDLTLGGETASTLFVNSVDLLFGTGPDHVETALLPDGSPGGFIGPAVPESSTWAMIVLGFAGLGYAAFQRSRKLRLEDSIA
jgi:hypothetical protein